MGPYHFVGITALIVTWISSMMLAASLVVGSEPGMFWYGFGALTSGAIFKFCFDKSLQ